MLLDHTGGVLRTEPIVVRPPTSKRVVNSMTEAEAISRDRALLEKSEYLRRLDLNEDGILRTHALQCAIRK